jgi:hypothetical protein
MQLVQDHLGCLDDLRVLQVSYVRKLELFEQLLEDIRIMEDEGHLQAFENKTNYNQCASDRVKWAMKVVSRDKRHIDHMIEDLTTSLNAVSSFLHTIKQKTHELIFHWYSYST